MSTRAIPLPQALLENLRTLREAGASFNAIAAILNHSGVPGRQGGRWFAASVRQALLQSGALPPASSMNQSIRKQGVVACLD